MPSVFVVMGNAYPDAVFTDEKKADAYVEEMQAKDKAAAEASGNKFAPSIYWRHVELPLEITVPDNDGNVPRIAKGHPDLNLGLDCLRANPESLRDALSLAAGALLATKAPGTSAAVLVAQLTLFPETDYTS